MTPPRFKGDDDDWLDDENSLGFGRGKAKLKSTKLKKKAQFLSALLANATVAEVFPKLCSARMDDDLRTLLCSYRRADVLRTGGSAPGQSGTGDEIRERSPVAVGDRVLVEVLGTGDGIVKGVCERKNRLARPAPDRQETNMHVLASNLDLLAIVASAVSPEFSFGIVDRFLVAAQAQGIPAILCVTKMDLVQGEERPWRIYNGFDTPVFELSKKDPSRFEESIKKLAALLEGKTVAFCGHSGVGKTSLLSQLVGREVGAVGEVNEMTGKGRHTTTGAVLLPRGNQREGTQWIDTPGVREFGLQGVEPENLAIYFDEFKVLRCARDSCTHDGKEEGCSLPGRESEFLRLQSYLRILESLRAGEY